MRNAELEAQIIANPDDAEAFAVYADWLEAHGDPRAELMRWQLRHEQEHKKWVRKQVDKVLARVEPVLFGELARRLRTRGRYRRKGASVLGWERGFVDWLDVAMEGDEPLIPFLAELLVDPSCVVLRRLWIQGQSAEAPSGLAATLARLVSPALRELHLNVPGELAGLDDLGELAIEDLHAGSWSGIGLAPETVRAVGVAAWPRLRELELSLGRSGAEPGDLEPLLGRRDLALDHLSLGGSRSPAFAGELIRRLLTSPLATRVGKLTLMIRPDAAAAELLVANRAHFAAATAFHLWDPVFNERMNGRA